MLKLVIILIVVVIIFIYYYRTVNINNIRHLSDSFQYAHFSKINAYNYFLYPQFLLFTSPQRFIINEGESLIIPKNWWHWVISTEKSFSINIWYNSRNEIKAPYKLNNLYNN